MSTTIRLFEPRDRSRWESLWADYNQFYCRSVEPRTIERLWNTLVENKGEPFGAAAEKDGEVIGLTHYFFLPSTSDWEPRCYLQDLFVDPNVRGGGVGRALIEAVYDHADKRGASQTYWLTAEDNVVARQLYDRVAGLTPFVKYAR